MTDRLWTDVFLLWLILMIWAWNVYAWMVIGIFGNGPLIPKWRLGRDEEFNVYCWCGWTGTSESYTNDGYCPWCGEPVSEDKP